MNEIVSTVKPMPCSYKFSSFLPFSPTFLLSLSEGLCYYVNINIGFCLSLRQGLHGRLYRMLLQWAMVLTLYLELIGGNDIQ